MLAPGRRRAAGQRGGPRPLVQTSGSARRHQPLARPGAAVGGVVRALHTPAAPGHILRARVRHGPSGDALQRVRRQDRPACRTSGSSATRSATSCACRARRRYCSHGPTPPSERALRQPVRPRPCRSRVQRARVSIGAWQLGHLARRQVLTLRTELTLPPELEVRLPRGGAGATRLAAGAGGGQPGKALLDGKASSVIIHGQVWRTG